VTENNVCSSGGSSPQYLGGPMASAVARAYNEGLEAELPAGSRGRAPRQGGFAPPEAEALLFFGRLMEAANLAAFLKFGKAKKSKKLCVIFAKKNHGRP